MTLAIAHLDGKVPVLDAFRERRPPFSPKQVASRGVCRSLEVLPLHHGCGRPIRGPVSARAFRDHGITYQLADQTKSDLYLNLLPC